MDAPSPSGAVDTCPLCAHSMIFDSGPSWSRIHSTSAAIAWSRGEKLPARSTECISTACRTISRLCRANVHSFSEDASTYACFRSSSHSNKESIISPVFCQKYLDRKSTRLNSSHLVISYAVFCLKKKKTTARASACPNAYVIYTHI